MKHIALCYAPFLLAGFAALCIAAMLPAQPAYADTITVTNTLDSGPGSLRQAVLGAAPGDTVVFDSAVFSAPLTITLSGQIEISKSLTLDGAAGGSHTPVISGSDAHRIFQVDESANVTLSELSLTHGYCACNGAALSVSGTLNLLTSTLSDNWAYAYAGGIYNLGTLNVQNSTFSGNYALYSGGAIYSAGILTVTNSTFVSNTASSGSAFINSGIYNVVSMTNSTLSANVAPANAHTIVNWGILTLTNSTISGNSGGGIYSFGTALLRNTIVANNPSGGNCRYVVVDGGNNLEDEDSCGFGPYTSTHSLTGTNPLLGPLGNYGGPVLTLPLLWGSPAIDAGNDDTCPPTDQRGIPRPQGAHCDIGAYEAFDRFLFLPAVLR